MRRKWTPEELALIKELYETHSTKEIAARLNTSVRAIYERAYALGLNKKVRIWNKGLKGEEFIKALPTESYEAISKTHIKKGSQPWNKGVTGEEYKSMLGDKLKNIEVTFWKKGNKPHNTLQGDGHIRVRIDKTGRPYKYIKIADGNWVLYHRYVWEQEHGPIAKGMIVTFIDGNSLNCDLKNLKLITMKENLQRQSVHTMPEELKPIVKMRSRITRKLNQLNQNK
jgi:hypothetical protein